MMPRRIEFHETLDLDGVTRNQAEHAILITPAGGGQCAFFAGDAVAYGTWASKDEYDLVHSPSQDWLDFLCDEMHAATTSDADEPVSTTCKETPSAKALTASDYLPDGNENRLRYLIDELGQTLLLRAAQMSREDIVKELGVPDHEGFPEAVQKAGLRLQEIRGEQRSFEDSIEA